MFFAYRSWLFTFCTYCNCCTCWTSLHYSYRLVISQMTNDQWPNNLVHVFVVLFLSWVWTYIHYNDQHRTNLQEKPLSSLKSGQRLPGNLVLTKLPWTLKINSKFKPHKKQMQRWSIYRTDSNPLERRWVFSLSRVYKIGVKVRYDEWWFWFSMVHKLLEMWTEVILVVVPVSDSFPRKCLYKMHFDLIQVPPSRFNKEGESRHLRTSCLTCWMVEL